MELENATGTQQNELGNNRTEESINMMMMNDNNNNTNNNNNNNNRMNNNNNNSNNGSNNGLRIHDAVGIVTDRTVRVFIKNIPFPLIERFDDQALVAELTEASNNGVTRYTMFNDKSGRFTGQAMCTFASAEAADQAIQALNGKQYSQNDEPLHLEHAKEHGVMMTSKLREIERDNRLAEQPWRRGDRYHRLYNPDGSLKEQNNFGRGGGGGGRGGFNNNRNNNNGGGGGNFAGRGRGMRNDLPQDAAALDIALMNWNNNISN